MLDVICSMLPNCANKIGSLSEREIKKMQIIEGKA